MYFTIAFFVWFFVSATKGLPGLKDMPTRFYVLIIAILVSGIILLGMKLGAIPYSFATFFAAFTGVVTSAPLHDLYLKHYIAEPVVETARRYLFGNQQPR